MRPLLGSVYRDGVGGGRGTSRTPLRSVVHASICDHRGTSLIRNRHPVGPYRRPMPRVLEGPRGVSVDLRPDRKYLFDA